MTKLYFSLFLIQIFLFISPSEAKIVIDIEEPSNFIVDLKVADNGSGNIEVFATADNAIGYEFYVGDDVFNAPVYNTSGIYNYTYTVSGVYNFETRVFGKSGKYLTQTTQISVQVEEVGLMDFEGGFTSPISYPNMNLVWADEFNGTTLNNLDWSYEIGTGSNGWGNNELQYYREENTTVNNGYLTIEAREENFGGKSYTSSRLITKDKKQIKYGRVDVRALLPKGQGIWPAIWMLGGNISSVGWPKCGEIDIMEMIGGVTGDKTIYGTIHWDNDGQHAQYGGDKILDSGIYNDKFHVFSIVWTSTNLTWFIDDVQFVEADITPADMSEFQQQMFFIFNVAVGGNWPGSPDSSTIFPQQMKVDYIRVFQDQ